MDLSIVVPCYNEADNIPLLLKRFLPVSKSINLELVLIDNGSTDNSAEVFKKELKKKQYQFARVFKIKKNIGYGHGIHTGLKKAKAPILAYTHADLQCDPKDVTRAYEEFKKENLKDKLLIKGERRGRKWQDLVFTQGLGALARVLTGYPFQDINGQPKLFSKKLVPCLNNPPVNFSYDLHVLGKAFQNGYQVKQIPVDFSQRAFGESKWAFSWRSKLKMILSNLPTLAQLVKARYNRK